MYSENYSTRNTVQNELLYFENYAVQNVSLNGMVRVTVFWKPLGGFVQNSTKV